MKLRGAFLCWLMLIALAAAGTTACAADAASQPMPTRPYYMLFASSIDRLVEACHVVFESVGRPDLAANFSERRKSYRDFAGIQRDKPLGMMSVWNDVAPADIVFLPVEDINELLKTATFGVVGFHSVGTNRFEIERPGSPYHALVRNDYVLTADSLTSIQALRVTPDQLTRPFRDRYDAVLVLDLKQIPHRFKTRYVEDLRSQVEPWLQQQDDEPAETANLRKAIGKLALDAFQRIVIDTSEITVGGRLDPKTRHLIFEVNIEAGKGTALANGLNRLVSRRSDFAPMISEDVPAGMALNLPLGNLVAQVVGSPSDPSAKSDPLEIGVQLAGSELGKLSLITAIRGPQAVELNHAVPRWIVQLDDSGKFASVHESFDVHDGVVFHSMIPQDMPDIITQLLGKDLEVIIGQGAEIIWLGVGSPEALLEQMKIAIDSLGKSSEVRSVAPLVRARFQAKQLPEFVPPDLLSSNLDAQASRDAFAKGQDGFNLVLEPILHGIKLRIELEEGFVRLIGKDWVKQIDHANR